ncbi:hypothetical protein [Microbacterium sp. 77mftsu3.1]|uniref:hypothetical protein n=1 Tax=Microbacterium sp. 77mftsu3.1 TaxID=1761802 RepID=UPI000367D781|nr:hypothetical protein [Microbacterium sp. 77mftsu3.1]SDH55521.1 hypothetical protein SAMN04488590_3564 [Microbacterium sp. 77mftsu3.1]
MSHLNTRTLASVLALSALLLAGCSSPSPAATKPGAANEPPAANTPSPQPENESPAAQEPAAKSLTTIAERVGVTGFAESSEMAPGASAWGKGQLDGSDVRIYEFADTDARDAFATSFESLGVTADDMVAHDLFLIAPNDTAQIDTIKAKLAE